MHRPAAIIFDLDDTLIARPGRVHEVWRDALAEMPELTARHAVDDIIAVLDTARAHAWSDARRRAGPVLDYAGARAALIEETLLTLGFAGDAALAARLNDGIVRHQGRASHLNEGGRDVLATLAGAGIPLALLTNGESRTQRRKIERFDLASFFAHILVEEEIGAGKPFDGAYVSALTQFACPACDVWFIGDHFENDIAGPKRHGMRTVWYNPERRPAPEIPHLCADAEIATLREVLDVLRLSTDEVLV